MGHKSTLYLFNSDLALEFVSGFSRKPSFLTLILCLTSITKINDSFFFFYCTTHWMSLYLSMYYSSFYSIALFAYLHGQTVNFFRAKTMVFIFTSNNFPLSGTYHILNKCLMEKWMDKWCLPRNVNSKSRDCAIFFITSVQDTMIGIKSLQDGSSG